MWLYLPDRFEMKVRHIFETIEGFAHTVRALRLESVYGATGVNEFREFKKFQDAAADTMRDEQRRTTVARSQFSQGGNLGNFGSFKTGRQRSDGRRVVHRNGRNVASEFALNFAGQPCGESRVASKLKKVIIRPDVWALKHELPDRCQYINVSRTCFLRQAPPFPPVFGCSCSDDSGTRHFESRVRTGNP